MFNIDFSSLPEISKKLSSEEITSLNTLFSDPIIQENLSDIEKNRISRKKWKIVIIGVCSLITLIASYIFGGYTEATDFLGRLFHGFFYTIGSGDDSFAPVVTLAIIIYSGGIGTLYKIYAGKIEVPLKNEVLSRICPLLYSKLEYNYDGRYSFDDINLLVTKGILSTYDRIDTVEDSVHFTMERDGKSFSVNGFEFLSSAMRGSGKNRRRVTTNHCYLLKAIFPNARIPLSDDLKIMKDQADSTGGSKLYIAIGFGFTASILMLIFTENFFYSIVGGIILGGMIYGAQKYYHTHNKKKVSLENIDFEKLFDVHCEDQITSRMIITPAFMDRIVSFVEKTGNNYEFLFQQNTLYIKRVLSKNYLEAGTEKNMLTNVAGFAQFYLDMKEIMQFINDMNLLYLSKTDINLKIEGEEIKSQPIHFDRTNISTGFIGFFAKRLGFQA